MLTWTAMSAGKARPDTEAHAVAADLLFRMTTAFPSWAGAILAVYSVYLCRFGALKIRLK
jgi:hypothetical protein